MTTIVLGLDALDADLLDRWGLTERLADHVARIDTFDNAATGGPHTRELWPTIITGRPPAEHGIRAAHEDGTVGWDSRWLRIGARAGRYVLPQTVRDAIGKRLRANGAGLSQETPDTYRERGLSTVFDGREHLALSIPNYYTDADRVLGLSSDRADLWDTVLAEKDSTGYRARVSVRRLTERLRADARRRLGAVEAAAEADYDLVFAWLGFVDSVGHLAPPIGAGWQRRQYERAVDWVEEVRERAPDDAAVIVVSDHGLRDGHHTHDAVLAGPTAAVQQADTVADVRDVIEATTPRRAQYPGMDGVSDHLAELGYLEGSA